MSLFKLLRSFQQSASVCFGSEPGGKLAITLYVYFSFSNSLNPNPIKMSPLIFCMYFPILSFPLNILVIHEDE